MLITGLCHNEPEYTETKIKERNSGSSSEDSGLDENPDSRSSAHTLAIHKIK